MLCCGGFLCLFFPDPAEDLPGAVFQPDVSVAEVLGCWEQQDTASRQPWLLEGCARLNDSSG